MATILFEGNSGLFPEWGLPPWPYDPIRRDDTDRDIILNFLKMVVSNEKSTRVYWFRPYSIKHDIEEWGLGNPKHVYIKRDLVTAGCLFMGIPVKMDPKDQRNTLVGFKLTEKQYRDLLLQAVEDY